MNTQAPQREAAPADYNLRFRDCLIGAQMLFVAFGALVLVPVLTGLDSNVALFTAGAGTLLFQLCTRGKVPVFLASSFAFIAPIIYAVQTWGIPQTLGGLACSGLVYLALSAVIRLHGIEVVLRVLPPVVTGPVIMVIGLILAPVAVNMALGKAGDGTELVPRNPALIISMTSLAVTVLVSLPGKGFLRLMPILCGIAAGFAVSLLLGAGDWSRVAATPWLRMPDFTFPEFSLQPILFIMPITLAPAIEHFGDVVAVSAVTGATTSLFGAIMVVGLNTLVRARQDIMEPRNMIIVALIIIFGVGGMQFSIGSFTLGGIGLAAVTGVLLNLLLPGGRAVAQRPPCGKK